MDRFDIHHEQYLSEWVEDSIRYLYEVCADYVPWRDAVPSASTSHGEENGSTVAQENSSPSLPATTYRNG